MKVKLKQGAFKNICPCGKAQGNTRYSPRSCDSAAEPRGIRPICLRSDDVGVYSHAILARRNKLRGFTLIELLVVIAIIGILSAFIVPSLASVRSKARDAKRIADIQSLQLALELYYSSNRTYPDIDPENTGKATLNLTLLVPDYIPVIPKDPLGSHYAYYACKAGSTVTGYHLGASLEESNNIALGNDRDADKNSGTCPGDFRGLNKSSPSSSDNDWACGNGSSETAGTAGPGSGDEYEKCYDFKR